MFKKTLLIFLGFFPVLSVLSQQLTPSVIASGGGSSTQSSYSLSYTIGEPAIKTFKSQNLVLTQGFHQTYSFFPLDTLYNQLTALPNPVTSENFNLLRLTFIISENVSSYIVSIYNISGKKVFLKPYDNLLKGEFKDIDFGNFASGIYLVKVQSKNGTILRTFKIEKL